MARFFAVLRRFCPALLALAICSAVVMIWSHASTPVTQSYSWQIPPSFDEAGDFSEGLAPVGIEKDGSRRHYGFIDQQGKLVIPNQYAQAQSFSEGLAAVGSDDNDDGVADLYGYIDRAGRYVLPPRYTTAESFSLGLAAVQSNGESAYIDRTGKPVLALRNASTSGFQDGLAAVAIEANTDNPVDGSRYGYMDRQGKLAIPFQFQNAGRFSEGLAFAKLDEHHVGYITKAGKFAFVLPTLDSDRAGEFHEGLAPVDLNEGMCSATNRCEFKYINPRGKVVIQPSKGAFTSAGAFSEGVAPVATGGGDREADGFLPVTNWGFIDRRGKLVVPGLFEQAGSVSEGLASACLSGKCGYIRLTGNRRS